MNIRTFKNIKLNPQVTTKAKNKEKKTKHKNNNK